MPCIIFKIGFFKTIITMPRKITKPAIVAKIAKAPSASTYAATKPPMILAKKLESNQTPIMSDANFTGANFVTTDNPTGERANSPIVCMR